ncbi:MAG TPA: hypothetical protein EYN96_03220 [Candidatus Hydrogenedentes bacterium]|nr:hypothetical protein [Candidatus Hydrogenedentota bacterium]
MNNSNLPSIVCVLTLLLLACSETNANLVPRQEEAIADQIELGSQHLLNWGKGMDTQAVGRPLRKMVVESGSFEAMMLLDEMQSKLRAEYLDEFPNLVIDETTSKRLDSDDPMEYLRTKSAGFNYSHQGDKEKAIEALIREAWLMSSTALIQLKIVVIYQVEGWPSFDRRIIQFFKDYSKEGIPRGQFVYGTLLLHGLGVEKDVIEGNRLIEVSGIDSDNR